MPEPATIETPAATSTPAPTIVPGSGNALIGNAPPTSRRMVDTKPPVVESTPEVDNSKILSIDDPESVFEESKPDENKPIAKPASKESKVDDKSTTSDTDKGRDKAVTTDKKEEKEEPGFDLGLEDAAKAKATTKSRDYSGIKQEYVDVLKHIPNYLYEKARETLLKVDKLEEENKKLKGDYDAIKGNKLPDNYYDHEKAYLLHPDYEKTMQESNLLDFEEQHCIDQLRNIKQGKPWRDLVGYRKDTGEPVYKDHEAIKDQIDIDGELYLNRILNNTGQRKLEFSKKLETISGEFKSKHEATTKALEEIDEKYFSKMKDITAFPKEAQEVYNQVKSVLKAKLPGLHDKVVDLFAKSYLSNLYKTQELAKRDALIKQLSEKQEDTERAGPTSKTLNGAGGKGGVVEKEYNTKDLESDWN